MGRPSIGQDGPSRMLGGEEEAPWLYKLLEHEHQYLYLFIKWRKMAFHGISETLCQHMDKNQKSSRFDGHPCKYPIYNSRSSSLLNLQSFLHLLLPLHLPSSPTTSFVLLARVWEQRRRCDLASDDLLREVLDLGKPKCGWNRPGSPSMIPHRRILLDHDLDERNQPGFRISPTILILIVVFAAIFFISGLIHLLARLLAKRRPNPANPSRRRRHGEESLGPEALQRQLQQLFHLHDSGLDQASIDALPVFLYEELVHGRGEEEEEGEEEGREERFDCAVCLSEFASRDKLRLLPACSHAFHIACIDAWLLCNSTCPLCRSTLFFPGKPVENPAFELDDGGDDDEPGSPVFPVRLGMPRNAFNGGDDDDDDEPGKLGMLRNVSNCSDDDDDEPSKLGMLRSVSNGGDDDHDDEPGKLVFPGRPGKLRNVSNGGEGSGDDEPGRIVFPVRLRKLRKVCNDGEGGEDDDERARMILPVRLGKLRKVSNGGIEGEGSGGGLDRRCYSMGSCQYVVGVKEMGVAVERRKRKEEEGKRKEEEGKRIWAGSKDESLSVSKIWQWGGHKGKLPAADCESSSFSVGPMAITSSQRGF
ncbi:uncharacterized protein LOC144709609 [Wolffia australiana]